MTLADQLEALAERASRVRSLLSFAPRPFVLEFAGSPKAGKSTSVDAISHFLRRNEFREHVLRERAAFCPIPMKGHLFFNTWCACTMLAEMLENVDSDCDVIIKDRGLFDTLLWLQRQFKHGEITEDEFNRIERFILMERWARIVDIVIVITVSPAEALEREHRPRISNLTGSVMNEAGLQSINDAIREAVPRYTPKFRLIKTYDTTGADPKTTNIQIARDVLSNFEEFLDPEIMVVGKSFVQKIIPEEGNGFASDEDKRILRDILKNVQFVRRSKAEESEDLVQIIACALLARPNEIFVFERKSRGPRYQETKIELYGKNTIWQGAHVALQEEPPEKMIANAIFTKLKNKLFLSREFESRYLGYAWNRNDPQSSKHLGLLYKLSIDSDSVAADLRSKEFRSGRGHGLSGRFLSVADVNAKSEELQLEPWSAAALRAGVGGA